jgi:hypothetical protein
MWLKWQKLNLISLFQVSFLTVFVVKMSLGVPRPEKRENSRNKAENHSSPYPRALY